MSMASISALEILGVGAVSAVGLTAAQTCAAIRAGIKRFCPIEAQILDDDEPQVGARVSADPRLRVDECEWLMALAGRALLECMPDADASPNTALLWLVPEAHRGHPLSTGVGDSELLGRIEALLGRRFAPDSRVLRGGAASCIEALGIAREQLGGGAVSQVVIGGADSLLRLPDLHALARDKRLLGPKQSQGLIPGEGAAFVRVGRPRAPEPKPESSESGESEAGESEVPRRVLVRGVGLGYERNTVLGTEYAVGEAFADALGTALQDADLHKGEIDFVAGNYNGERYDAWEISHAHARCHEPKGERLIKLWPSMSTGELGVAGGVMAVIAAASAISEDYAAGPTAAIEVRSDGELRGVALVCAADEQ